MLLRRFLPVGLVLGLLTGVGITILVPRTPAETSPAPTVEAGILRTGKARQPSVAQVRLRVLGAAPRVIARQDDPDGGPPWALRVADVARVVPKAIRRRGVDPVIGHGRCAQLVRLVSGQPGWLDERGTWRPVAFQMNGAPVQCLPRSRVGNHAALEVFSTLRFPDGDPARATLLRGVAYGLLPPHSTATLKLEGRAASVDRAAGAFLALAAPGLRRSAVRLEVRTAARTRIPIDAERPGPHTREARLAARAPDPAGGLPYAAYTFKTTFPRRFKPQTDVPCIGSGPRIVDDRMGSADLALGTFKDGVTGGGGGCGFRLTRRQPLNFGYGSTNDPTDPDTTSGRITRRLQPGRTSVYGTAMPAVKTLTVATPRDVRTLVPTGPAHAFITVYDGNFPSGELVLTAHLDDGRTVTQRARLGGI